MSLNKDAEWARRWEQLAQRPGAHTSVNVGHPNGGQGALVHVDPDLVADAIRRQIQRLETRQ